MGGTISGYEAKVYSVSDTSPIDETQSRDLLEILMTQFFEEMRCGTHPQVSEYVKRHPHLADEINELFPIVMGMEQWKASKDEAAVQREHQLPIKLEKVGAYKIVREIGRGGMGVVFEAVHEQSSQKVALKLLLTGYARAAKWRKRFHNEARLAAQLQHPNIVSILDFGEEDASCYYTMQLVEGMSLHWLIKRLAEPEGKVAASEIQRAFTHGDVSEEETKSDSKTGKSKTTRKKKESSGKSERCIRRNAWRQITKIGIQIAKALQNAHQAGTLHRDIKPSNLLLDARGNIRITDFGLAQLIEEQSEIQSAIVAGTLRYMAPECLEGVYDERSDVYAFGATLYELTTLHPMITGDNPTDIISGIQHGAIAPPRAICPSMPRELEAIINKATQLLSTDRYQTARHIKRDLANFYRGKPIDAPPMMTESSVMNLFHLKKQ